MPLNDRARVWHENARAFRHKHSMNQSFSVPEEGPAHSKGNDKVCLPRWIGRPSVPGTYRTILGLPKEELPTHSAGVFAEVDAQPLVSKGVLSGRVFERMGQPRVNAPVVRIFPRDNTGSLFAWLLLCGL